MYFVNKRSVSNCMPKYTTNINMAHFLDPSTHHQCNMVIVKRILFKMIFYTKKKILFDNKLFCSIRVNPYRLLPTLTDSWSTKLRPRDQQIFESKINMFKCIMFFFHKGCEFCEVYQTTKIFRNFNNFHKNSNKNLISSSSSSTVQSG